MYLIEGVSAVDCKFTELHYFFPSLLLTWEQAKKKFSLFRFKSEASIFFLPFFNFKCISLLDALAFFSCNDIPCLIAESTFMISQHKFSD